MMAWQHSVTLFPIFKHNLYLNLFTTETTEWMNGWFQFILFKISLKTIFNFLNKLQHSAISINVKQLENLFEPEVSNSFKYTLDYPSGHGSRRHSLTCQGMSGLQCIAVQFNGQFNDKNKIRNHLTVQCSLTTPKLGEAIR